jgi:hypothetical protein
MSSNDKFDATKIPAPQPLPAVQVEEVADTDLDDMAGGDCSADSCNGTCGGTGTCGSTGNGKKKVFAV